MKNIKKLIFISDTHRQHYDMKIPNGDFIIHCGDISGMGRINEIEDFSEWFSKLPHKYKIMIPGNHDFGFENKTEEARNIIESRGIICLIDQSIELESIKFWGSPISPYFNNWAFNRFRGSSIEHHWNKIPENTDVLITHGPPAYINNLSSVIDGEDVGCEDLYKAIKRIKPKISCFGHIHEGYGTYEDEDTLYINCSLLNRSYYYTNKPIQVKYAREKFSLYKSNTKRK